MNDSKSSSLTEHRYSSKTEAYTQATKKPIHKSCGIWPPTVGNIFSNNEFVVQRVGNKKLKPIATGTFNATFLTIPNRKSEKGIVTQNGQYAIAREFISGANSLIHPLQL